MRVMKGYPLRPLDAIKSINLRASKIFEGLGFIDRLVLRYSSSIKVGDYGLAGWGGKLPFYLFKCSEHGYVINYPSGHYMRLACPFCVNKGEKVFDGYVDRSVLVEEPVVV